MRVNDMTFAERLRVAREAAGISGKELATSAGVKYHTYMSYENRGREPKQETLIKIAAALNVSIDELLGYSIVKNKSDFYTGLQNLIAMLDSPELNWAGKKFAERDVEELLGWLKALHFRAKDMANRRR